LAVVLRNIRHHAAGSCPAGLTADARARSRDVEQGTMAAAVEADAVAHARPFPARVRHPSTSNGAPVALSGAQPQPYAYGKNQSALLHNRRLTRGKMLSVCTYCSICTGCRYSWLGRENVADPFMAEIRIMSFNWAPKGWAMCNGQLLPINQNQALFSLLGTTWGGNGQTTFALPDQRGRVPIHVSDGYPLGQVGFEQAHTLTIAEMPQHVHGLNATTVAAASIVAVDNLLATAAATDPLYSTNTNITAMAPSSIGIVGGSQAHTNMQPYLTVNFCIALNGIFPAQN
jgi:microcystin-dependent protein